MTPFDLCGATLSTFPDLEEVRRDDDSLVVFFFKKKRLNYQFRPQTFKRFNLVLEFFLNASI